MNRWKPNVTVATVIERTNEHKETEYLLVHELLNGKLAYNQPAGHLEEGESLIDAAIRETLEETGWQVAIAGLIGIYRYIAPDGTTYLRHAFSANTVAHNPNQPLDKGVQAAVWLTYSEIVAKQGEMYSVLVKQTIDDYRQKNHYPLEIFQETE